jgi:hypothetical protein
MKARLAQLEGWLASRNQPTKPRYVYLGHVMSWYACGLLLALGIMSIGDDWVLVAIGFLGALLIGWFSYAVAREHKYMDAMYQADMEWVARKQKGTKKEVR